MRTALLTGKQFATSSLAPSLAQAFDKANVRCVSPAELRPSLYRQIDFLVLPGITGEKSPYPDILRPGREASDLYRAIEDGLIVKVECASLYWADREIVYTTSDGRLLKRDGLGWIDGLARNLGRSVATDEEYRYADTTTANIEFYNASETIYTPICISNGPALFLSETEQKNPAVRITSRFIDAPENPVSSLTKTIGLGLLDGAATLPHIRSAQLNGRLCDPIKERHRAALFNTIAAHEHSIAAVETCIYDHIKTHYAGLSSQSLRFAS